MELFDTTGFVNQADDIDIDFASGKIYMCDAGGPDMAIFRSNLDGSNVETIYSSWVNEAALDLDNGKIYWTDQIDGQILRANLDGSGVEVIHTGLGGFPQGITIAPAPPRVPTVSEWGVVSMSLLMLIAGTSLIRCRPLETA